ncbi:hypothetical protein KZO01_11310 [Kurthia zopfii]|nr:hypothetical protein KZO01_11310 [Kurthia zopfii]
MDFTNTVINLIKGVAAYRELIFFEKPKIFTNQFSLVDEFNCRTIKLCLFKGMKV